VIILQFQGGLSQAPLNPLKTDVSRGPIPYVLPVIGEYSGPTVIRPLVCTSENVHTEITVFYLTYRSTSA